MVAARALLEALSPGHGGSLVEVVGGPIVGAGKPREAHEAADRVRYSWELARLAGDPGNGDPRASYAIFESGVAEIRRVEYDIEAAIVGIRKMGLAADITEALMTILRTGQPCADPVGKGRPGQSD
jgi:hypothetical protein